MLIWCNYQQDQNHFSQVAGRHIEQIVQAACYLLSAETKWHGKAEERGHDRNDVDEVPQRTPDRIAKYRIESRTYGQWQTTVKAKVC